MAPTAAVIAGTLKPDGTLVLDEKPKLQPGRVTVYLRQDANSISTRPLDDEFFRAMETIWSGQAGRGHVARAPSEIDSAHRELNEQMDGELDAAIRLQEDSRRNRPQSDAKMTAP